jgi:hypothetical protein
MWFRFQAGRITASRMKQVCRTNLTKPAESLIKSVCYPGENKFPNAVENYIEVKCPYCIRNCKLDETVVITTCLKASDGTFQLNRAHKYYCQVQTQLLLSDKDYVDFVLWTMSDLHIERIQPDAEIIAKSKSSSR